MPADDVFYFGNAVGETGNSPYNALVTAADVIAARDNPRGPGNRAALDNPHDFDHDMLVNAVDVILARNHATGPFDALRLIAPPLSNPASAEAEGEQTIGEVRIDGPVTQQAVRATSVSTDKGDEQLRSWQFPSRLGREPAALALQRMSLSRSFFDRDTKALDRRSTETLPEHEFAELDHDFLNLLTVDWR